MDSSVRQDILDRLLEYGDQVLGDDDSQNKVTSSSSRRAEGSQPHAGGKVKKKKMKKKKKKRTGSPSRDEGQTTSKEKNAGSKQTQSSMKDFEEELRTFMATVKEKKEKEDEVNEMDRRKDSGRTKKRKPPEVIVFDDPTKRKRERTGEASCDDLERKKGMQQERGIGDELDTARHDVWKFAISGLTFEDREKQEIAKAIQLGAKPPRKEYVNYKELMELKKQRNEEEIEQRELNHQMGLKTAKRTGDRIQLRNKGFWTDSTQQKGVYIDGQLGKYKRGVQVITKRDMTRMKTARGRGGKR